MNEVNLYTITLAEQISTALPVNYSPATLDLLSYEEISFQSYNSLILTLMLFIAPMIFEGFLSILQ